MQFVWQHRLGLLGPLTAVDGRRVRVIDQGRLNTDAGPDFFNATVEIDGQTWVGNVEIHVKASDWMRHGHHTDRAYDSVILHVVQVDDMAITRPDGQVIPQLVIRCTDDAARRCNALVEFAARSLPCEATVRAIHPIYITEWLTALGMERLFKKSERIKELVDATDGHWEGAAYITLARGLGFGLNSEPFELLAKSLPLNFLQKHSDELPTVEALIFGQAGLIPLPSEDEDPYLTKIRSEYAFMARKFSLQPGVLQWKMARTRPQNFPHRRLAMLAEMIHRGFYIMGRLTDCKSIEEMRQLFDAPLTGFWANHFTFAGKGAGCTPRALSRASMDTLLINVAIPLRHARCAARGDLDGMTQCGEWLMELAPESNSIVTMFTAIGIACRDAFTSQALIELRREYCEKKKCIFCRIGHRMLSTEIVR